ncbi:MAG: hypothetical protein JWN56_893 [Sphingobacteriales bacterium]|nr:hypothetical protein [Sphingobacteriales bacterium]
METTLKSSSVNVKSLALKNGLIWAAINIAIFLVIYYVKADLMGSFAFSGIQMLVGIGLAVYFCIDMRKQIGGYWSFKEALSSIFLMFFVQALVVYFFTIIFGKFIEPDYVAKMKEITQNTATAMLEKVGMDQEKIDQAISDMDKKSEAQFNPGFVDILKSIAFIAFSYFIGALIFAAIFKRDHPVFASAPEE